MHKHSLSIPASTTILVSLLCFLAPACKSPTVATTTATATAAPVQYNVLFIPVDDLNHWIGFYGRNAQVKTPNLDKFAASATSFTNAHCAAPSCCPSRAALMSGLRPSSTGVYINANDWRTVIPVSQTIPAHFRNNGYKVMGGGKVYHGGFDRRSDFEFYFRGGSGNDIGGDLKERGSFSGIRWGIMKGGDEALHDYDVASWAIAELGKTHSKPFFIAPGIFRPHMPWNVPEKYYELYPLESIQLPPYLANDLDDIPEEGKAMALEMNDYTALMQTANPELEWKKAIRGYLASISFADAQIGRILDALNESAYAKNTIVVLWGDHGWHLNEKNHWRKFALWEEATRAPLIYRVPGLTTAGAKCTAPVDFLSVFPTLTQLCGLPMPAHAEGVSLVPLLKNVQAPWEHVALTTHGFQNHAVRTGEWRYIRYKGGGEELYNEKADPYEWKNLAGDAQYKSVIEKLRKYLPATNKKPIPNSTPGRESQQ